MYVYKHIFLTQLSKMLNLLINHIVKLAHCKLRYNWNVSDVVRNFTMGTQWAKSTFCGVEVENMFIKLDLVLPRGLSSLYSMYIKEERPFG